MLIPVSSRAHFNANKNSVDQTGIASNTPTTVTFGTELYDIGGYYNAATSTWTPPAGRVTMTARIKATGTITAGGSAHLIAIMRNGIRCNSGYQGAVAMTNQLSAVTSFEELCSGTDAYTVSATITLGSGTATIVGTLDVTNFCGHWIGLS